MAPDGEIGWLRSVALLSGCLCTLAACVLVWADPADGWAFPCAIDGGLAALGVSAAWLATRRLNPA
jgi:hypothetical protein